MPYSHVFSTKKRTEPSVYGLCPLRYDKDTTFFAEIQIELTFGYNVKRRDLHKPASAVCYITREEGTLRLFILWTCLKSPSESAVHPLSAARKLATHTANLGCLRSPDMRILPIRQQNHRN